jgi:hypothetical protein
LLRQPLLGVAASAVAIALSLAYLTLFDFPTFAGWVAFVMLALIPAQVVLVVLVPGALSTIPQPARGAALVAITAAAALAISPLAVRFVGEGVSPPGPIPTHYFVIVVPTTFLLAIAFGGWPFTLVARNRWIVAALTLAASYALTFVIFRALFNYDAMRGAPVYLATAPQGLFDAVWMLVFYVTVLAGMFVLLHFDLWPLTRVPSLMRQPLLGIIWVALATAIAAAVMAVAGAAGMAPMFILTGVTAPFIFGTIIVLNMLQNSPFACIARPALKGASNLAAAALIGLALASLFQWAAPAVVGPLPSGPPGYEAEIWLVNALLSVTFPFLVYLAACFEFWPLARSKSG